MLRALASSLVLVVAIGPAKAIQLQSSDVKDGAPVPLQQVYTRCGGNNVSPALAWNGIPRGTHSIAVTVIDQSVAPSGWSHWIVVNLPASTTVLARGVANLPAGSIQIRTNFGDAQYAGPCPPPGSGVHRYEFTVWALKTAAPTIASDEAATSVIQKLQSVTIEKSSLAATYQR